MSIIRLAVRLICLALLAPIIPAPLLAQEVIAITPVEIKVYAERYYGKRIQIEGHIAQAGREDAIYGINAGDAGVVTFSIWWGKERGADWEKALSLCGAGFRSDDQCKAIISGVVTQNTLAPDVFSLKDASVRFLK